VAVRELLHLVDSVGEPVAPSQLDVVLPDPKDLPFIEVAVAASADALVTGNVKHFPKHATAGVPILSLRAFLEHRRAASSP
jgi:predicted nucleic acid-binding protein